MLLNPVWCTDYLSRFQSSHESWIEDDCYSQVEEETDEDSREHDYTEENLADRHNHNRHYYDHHNHDKHNHDRHYVTFDQAPLSTVLPRDTEDCCICLESLMTGDRCYCSTTCGTVFHAHCIASTASSLCPVCRNETSFAQTHQRALKSGHNRFSVIQKDETGRVHR